MGSYIFEHRIQTTILEPNPMITVACADDIMCHDTNMPTTHTAAAVAAFTWRGAS